MPPLSAGWTTKADNGFKGGICQTRVAGCSNFRWARPPDVLMAMIHLGDYKPGLSGWSGNSRCFWKANSCVCTPRPPGVGGCFVAGPRAEDSPTRRNAVRQLT